MSRIDEIRNRTLSHTDKLKIEALAGNMGASTALENLAPAPTATGDALKKENPEYLLEIVTDYYDYFKKVSPEDAASLTLSAVILRAGGVVAVSVKDAVRVPVVAVEVKKKRGRPAKNA